MLPEPAWSRHLENVKEVACILRPFPTHGLVQSPDRGAGGRLWWRAFFGLLRLTAHGVRVYRPSDAPGQGGGGARLVPSSIFLGTDISSGQPTSFLLPPSCSGQLVWLTLGTQGPIPSSMGQAVGTDEQVQEAVISPYSAASRHPLCHSHTAFLGLSFPVCDSRGLVCLTPGPSPAVPFCGCEILRAEEGKRDGPSFSTSSPCPPGSP